jgi:hypothetical protein
LDSSAGSDRWHNRRDDDLRKDTTPPGRLNMRRIFVLIVAGIGLYIIARIAALKLKHGASLENVSWRMFWAAIVLDGIYRDVGQEAIITSGGDGKHSRTSKHYAENNLSGMIEALDFRTWHVDAEEIAAKARKKLGPDYDVVVEATHLHVEYDPA